MRVSTANTFEAGINSLAQRQRGLLESQDQLTSLKRVNKASDDPAAAARAERALAQISRGEANQRAVDASRTVIGQVEGALGDATRLLQDVREALVAAGNGTYTDAERQIQADKLRGLRAQLFDVANRGDGANGFLFGAQGAAQPPFVDAPRNPALPIERTGVVFFGSSGTAMTEPSVNLPLSGDGRAIWLNSRTGNGVFQTVAGDGLDPALDPRGAMIDGGQVTNPSAVTGDSYRIVFNAGGTTYDIFQLGNPVAIAAAQSYSAGQAITGVPGVSFTISGTPEAGDQFMVQPSAPDMSVFGAIDKAIADLSLPGRTGPQIAQRNAENLRNVDTVLGGILSARAAAGEVLNRADAETDRLSSQKLAAQTERSAAEDLDMVAAISDFQRRQTGYDAALKSYAMVQRMSLFQYLNV